MMTIEIISVVLASSGQFGFAGMAIWLAVLLFSSTVHESAHAYVAWRCGDSTARDLGRITLNPLMHLDMFYSFLMPAMMLIASGGRMAFGGAKPVPVNYYNLRHPKRDMMWVALAGPVSNVILAIGGMLLFRVALAAGLVEWQGARALFKILDVVIYANVLLATFNMLPIPPLDGSRVLARYLTGEAEIFYLRMERYGMMILIGLFYFVRPFRKLVFGMVEGIYNVLMYGVYK